MMHVRLRVFRDKGWHTVAGPLILAVLGSACQDLPTSARERISAADAELQSGDGAIRAPDGVYSGHSAGACPYFIDIDEPFLNQGDLPIEWDDETYSWGVTACGPAHTTIGFDWYRVPAATHEWIYIGSSSCHAYDGLCTAFISESYSCGQTLEDFRIMAYPQATGQHSYTQDVYDVIAPIKCRLSVAISGPNTIFTADWYQWEAIPSGGNNTYSYQWEVDWNYSGNWQTLGTAKTQSLYVDGYSGHFTLRVTVSSAGQVKSSSISVYNQIGCGMEIC